MPHLATDQLLDLAEGTAAPAATEQATAHLASCTRCVEELARARTALAMAREPLHASVPDPSPLFWDHLSARVQEAIAAEPPPQTSWFDVPWGWRAWIPAAAAVGVIALAIAVSLSIGRGDNQPSRLATNTQAATGPTIDVVEASPTADDPALAFLTDLAGDFEWDDVADAGLMAGSSAIDRAMSELSADERVELHRLLNEELKQWKTPGA
jgi:hypothetical protein